MLAFVVALVLPCVALAMMERWGAAVGALLLQATILGWPVATIWALLAQRAADETLRAPDDGIS
ncbi:YqaE/Pmp3 family membrane protein [Salinarimonas ramus]|uniref:Proteolipid membrane potential modulator n=1 Tax=Salinarimonas ramus TaxID=690164 RepID=A0A917Q5S8_9HYPH|nr:YqaE/Pmp3 family membrane protein [Salinarimonas ramus]GGK25721.1 hypothetical protein GCM10011322_10320 [Salinarimonas ramus]